jgi:hypothetical protein
MRSAVSGKNGHMRVLGVDGCRGGRVGIVLDGCPEAMFAPEIAGLVADAGSVEGIAIDITGIGESFPANPSQVSPDGRLIAIWA